jgi:hypothetical protein
MDRWINFGSRYINYIDISMGVTQCVRAGRRRRTKFTSIEASPTICLRHKGRRLDLIERVAAIGRY